MQKWDWTLKQTAAVNLLCCSSGLDEQSPTLVLGMLGNSFADSLDNELKQSSGIGLTQLDRLKSVNVTITLAMVYLIQNNMQKLD